MIEKVFIFLTISTCVLCVSSDDQKNIKMYDGEELDFAGIMMKCNETFNIDKSYIESLNDTGSFPDETFKTPKCYIRCMLEETGIITSEDKFNTTRTAMIFSGARNGRMMTDLEELADKCVNRDETCKCERSYEYIKCFMEKEIEKYEEGQK